MCTKYLNANVSLFKSITKNNNEVVAFYDPFDCIYAEYTDGIYHIKDFNIVTNINLIESDGKKAKNILDEREILQVKIRLTKSSKDKDFRISLDLDSFEIDTSKSSDIYYDACVPYLNYSRITHIEDIVMDIDNPLGNYIIKVLVKKPSDEKYTIQSLYHLNVKNGA